MAPPVSAPRDPRPFSQTWTLADSRALFDLEACCPEDTSPGYDEWRTRYQACTGKWGVCMGEDLAFRARTGQLEPIDAMGYQVGWVEAWNRLFGSDDWTHPAAIVAHRLESEFLYSFAAMNFRRQNNEGASPENLHAYIQYFIAAGTMPARSSHLDFECTRTGERVRVDIDQWKVQLGRNVRDAAGRYRFEPFTERAPLQATHHHVLPVPTGELWVADWFRMPTLSSLAKDMDAPGMGRGPDSISSVEGCARRTRAYAEEMGIGHLFVGSRRLAPDECPRFRPPHLSRRNLF